MSESELDLDLLLLASLCAVREQSAGELASELERNGKKIPRDVISLALADLQRRLASNPTIYPFLLEEDGPRWILKGRSQIADGLLSRGKVLVREPLSERDLQVLAVITFQATGVSSSRINECIGLDPSKSLEKLRRQELIYPIPKHGWTHWCPSPNLLQRFGFKKFEDIPNFQEYREFVEGKKEADQVLKETAGPTQKIKRRKRSRRS